MIVSRLAWIVSARCRGHFATFGTVRGTERDMDKVWTFLLKSFELETQKNCSLSSLPLFSWVTKLPLSHSVHNLAKQSTGMLASEAMRKESGLAEHMYAALLPARHLQYPISVQSMCIPLCKGQLTRCDAQQAFCES